ncbi:MAG: peptidylprolyl isomerase [Chitinivibrionales bacterium]|nr:peptidylprolyl isomerase [Chitinivibrionales bacterium]
MKRTVLCLACLLFMCSSMNTPKDAVANVNGTWIKRGDVEKMAEMVRQNMMRMQPEKALGDMTAGLRKDVTQQLVANELLLQEAARRKISADSGAIGATLARIHARFPDEATFQKELVNSGKSLDDVRKDIRQGLMLDSLMKTLLAKVDSITPVQCKAYYDANPSMFIKGKRLRASHILFIVPKTATPEQKEKIRKQAEGVLTQVKTGGNFVALAKKYSADPASAKNGGDLGWFNQGDMKGPFETAVLNQKLNEVSPIVKSDIGFHIVKKTGEEAAAPAKFEDVKDRIRMSLEYQQRGQFVRHYVDSLKTLATIKYTDTAFAPAMPSAQALKPQGGVPVAPVMPAVKK